MTHIVKGPTLQPLGFQGEEYFLKIVFPVNELTHTDGDTYNDSAEAPEYEAGKRGIILKFKLEDLPMHSHVNSLMHFDVGRAIREHHERRS